MPLILVNLLKNFIIIMAPSGLMIYPDSRFHMVTGTAPIIFRFSTLAASVSHMAVMLTNGMYACYWGLTRNIRVTIREFEEDDFRSEFHRNYNRKRFKDPRSKRVFCGDHEANIRIFICIIEFSRKHRKAGLLKLSAVEPMSSAEVT